MSRLFPYLALPLGIVLLQWHGMPFWMVAAGPIWGAGASAALELTALWAWWEMERTAGEGWRRTGWFLLAGLTSALLIGAPLYVVSKPLWVTDVTLASIETELGKLDGQRDGFVQLAIKRNGWQSHIDGIDARESALWAQRNALLTGDAGLEWQRRFRLLAELLALGIFGVTTVVAIRRLAEQHNGKAVHDERAIQASGAGNGPFGAGLFDVVPAGTSERLGKMETGLESDRAKPMGIWQGVNSAKETTGNGGENGNNHGVDRVRSVESRNGEAAPQRSVRIELTPAARANAEKWAERIAWVQRVTALVSARYPQWETQNLGSQTDPRLSVELSRLKSFPRDIERLRQADKTAKPIGPAELERLEKWATEPEPAMLKPEPQRFWEEQEV